jgi:iron complex outermembrane receptor protein
LFSQYEIYGKVTDEAGTSLIGANVYLDQSFRGAVTDVNGSYAISRLPGGTYVITVSYMGYDPASRLLTLPGDAEFNFVLKRATYLAEEVIVASTRAGQEVPVSFTNIERKDIRERNLGQDLPYLLSLSPSLVTTSDAGTGIGYTSFRIRGTDMNRINITINGVPLNDAESHGVWFIDLPDLASSVENVQVQRGVGTSTNGAGAFGATINMGTCALSPEPYSEWNASAGSFKTFKNTFRIGSGLINDHVSFELRMSELGTDGYIDRASAELSSYCIQGAYQGEKSLLKIHIFSGKEKTYQAWSGVPGDLLETHRTFNPSGIIIGSNGDTSFYDNETDNYQQDHYQLFFSRELGRHLVLNTAFHYTHGRGYYEQYRQDCSLGDYGIGNVITDNDTITSTDLIRQKWLDNDFYGMIFSFNYHSGKFGAFIGGGANEYEGRHFGKVIWARFAGDSEINQEWYRSTGDKTDANLYAKVNYRIPKQLDIFGDLQYRLIRHRISGLNDDLREISQDHDYGFFNPKIGIHYILSNTHRLFFSAALAHREPNRSNFVDANPGKIPGYEALTDYELGYKLRLSNTIAEATIYYMDYNDQLVLTGEINDVGAPVMTNIKDSYRAGIELVGGFKPVQRLRWDINLTLSRNKIKDYTEYVDDWDNWGEQITKKLGETNLSFSPAVTAASKISYEIIDNLSLELLSKFVGKQYTDNTSSDERMLDPYLVNDIGLRYSITDKFAKELCFNVLVYNILNSMYESNAWVYRYYSGGREYRMDGFFPQAGRNFLAGMSLRF